MRKWPGSAILKLELFNPLKVNAKNLAYVCSVAREGVQRPGLHRRPGLLRTPSWGPGPVLNVQNQKTEVQRAQETCLSVGSQPLDPGSQRRKQAPVSPGFPSTQ